jgi:hypothetical protein
MLQYSTVASRLSLLTWQTAAACTVRSLLGCRRRGYATRFKNIYSVRLYTPSHMLLRSVIKPLNSRYGKAQGYELLCWNFLILRFVSKQQKSQASYTTMFLTWGEKCLETHALCIPPPPFSLPVIPPRRQG